MCRPAIDGGEPRKEANGAESSSFKLVHETRSRPQNTR
jgi:hypothetical protein